jgi:hypothetical protein
VTACRTFGPFGFVRRLLDGTSIAVMMMRDDDDDDDDDAAHAAGQTPIHRFSS